MQVILKRLLLLIFSGSISFISMAQIPVGTWRDHLPYVNGDVVAVTKDRVYCATELALFYFEKNDNAIFKLSKINKLSDLGVGYIAYSDTYNKLVIGYTNGNIDILVDDRKFNYPDIKFKNIIADKSIYHIQIVGDLAYLSTGFGIVVFNLKKDEFADTYIIGPGGSYSKINNTAIYNNEIFALTDNGVLRGELDDPFLGNFENWVKVDSLLNSNEKYFTSVVFNNTLYLANNIGNVDSCHISFYDGQHWDTLSTTRKYIKSFSTNGQTLTIVDTGNIDVFNTEFEKIATYKSYSAQHAIYDKDNNLWVASWYGGLRHYVGSEYRSTHAPDGPYSNKAFNLFNNNGNILVAPGGHRLTGENNATRADVYQFSNENWSALHSDAENEKKLNELKDVVSFASQNRSNTYVAATWGYGLIEVVDNEIVNVYNTENTDSILGNYISGCAFDEKGNLYMVCRNTSYPFVTKTADNKWYRYNYNGNLTGKQTHKLINTYNNDKWTISQMGEGIFVYNDNGTPESQGDDVYTSFSLKTSGNEIISERINDIVQDVEGAIWLATNNGIAVYDYPQYALENDPDFYARVPQIVVEGYLKGLLEGENVTAIAVDGANRKWLGTEGGGLFLVSADGTEQIMVWDTDNSKLFSNNIFSVDINQKTGEVFIGTDKGIQSFKGTATQGASNYDDIYAFPNPVTGDYTGIITIRGLVYQTQIKITDISGHRVYETISNGGDAIWNGLDMNGTKVSSGVYLVMCTLPDGSQKEATKILIVK